MLQFGQRCARVVSKRHIYSNVVSRKAAQGSAGRVLSGSMSSGGRFPSYSAPDESKGTEDAFATRDQLLAVADGVGSWKVTLGIDAGIFARGLMDETANAFEAQQLQGSSTGPTVSSSVDASVNSATRALAEAHRRVMARKIWGGSTALVCSFGSEALDVVNVGDCLCLVLRDGDLIFRSAELAHGFNHPYQLSYGTDGDSVADGEQYRVSVRPGDVVVLATDGLSDNLFTEEVVSIIGECIQAKRGPSSSSSFSSAGSSRLGGVCDDISNQLVSATMHRIYEEAVNLQSVRTPFGELRQREQKQRTTSNAAHVGGGRSTTKLDDVLVLSAMVEEKSS